MSGLYVLKPWYAARLSRVRRVLVDRRVSPNTVTAVGVGFGAAAGLVLALRPPGLVTALMVGLLLAARLACANLDGGVARASGRASRRGLVVNELGDRLAELAVLAGLLAWTREGVGTLGTVDPVWVDALGWLIAPAWLVVAAALAASAPSWVALAGAAAGAPRIQGGPVGKTERCVILVAIAATGWAGPLLLALIVGSLLTAGLRLAQLRSALS